MTGLTFALLSDQKTRTHKEMQSLALFVHDRTYIALSALAVAVVASAYFRRSRARRPQDCADFDSFLKECPRTAAPTGFGAFLKDGGVGTQDEGSQDPQQAPEETTPEGAVRVVLMFGTEYGFSKEIAEKLAGRLKGTGSFWYGVRAFLNKFI